MFLQTRRCEEKVGNLLSIDTDGWMSIWSVHCRGGMLAYFYGCAKRELGDSVSVMTTDRLNELLVTADTRGYIRTWDISSYCNGKVTKALEQIFNSYEKHRMKTVSFEKL